MRETDIELIQGTLTVVILKTVSWKPQNGYAIAQWVRQTTDGELEIDEGALYPALHRMEHRGWLTSEWGLSANNRRAKFYRLTPAGRRMLRVRTAGWERLVRAVAAVMQAEINPA